MSSLARPPVLPGPRVYTVASRNAVQGERPALAACRIIQPANVDLTRISMHSPPGLVGDPCKTYGSEGRGPADNGDYVRLSAEDDPRCA